MLKCRLAVPETLDESFVVAFEQDEDEKMMLQLNTFQRVYLKRELQAKFEEGSRKSKSETLQKLLAKRFGPLPVERLNQISNASSTEIDAWLDRFLEATDLDDVFRSP